MRNMLFPPLSHHTKRLILGLLASTVLLALASLTAACNSNGTHPEGETQYQTEAELSIRDRHSFMAYLEAHGETARLLYEQPERIKDRQFLSAHHTLRDWLATYPKAAEAIQANPYRVLWAHDLTHRRATDILFLASARSLDPCLDTHWEEADALYRNPKLINNTLIRARSSFTQ